MKFIIGGEDWMSYFERMAYDGAIGIFYKDTLSGVLAYLIVGLLCLFAIIGFITVLRLIFRPRKKKMSAEEKWMKTGKY